MERCVPREGPDHVLIMCLEYDRFPFVLKACQCSDDVFEITRVGEYR